MQINNKAEFIEWVDQAISENKMLRNHERMLKSHDRKLKSHDRILKELKKDQKEHRDNFGLIKDLYLRHENEFCRHGEELSRHGVELRRLEESQRQQFAMLNHKFDEKFELLFEMMTGLQEEMKKNRPILASIEAYQNRLDAHIADKTVHITHA